MLIFADGVDREISELSGPSFACEFTRMGANLVLVTTKHTNHTKLVWSAFYGTQKSRGLLRGFWERFQALFFEHDEFDAAVFRPVGFAAALFRFG